MFSKVLVFSMVFSFIFKWNNFFILLLSLEIGVLSLFLIFSLFLPEQFILMIFIFVMGSIMGLLIFMLSLKNFSSYFSMSWYY